MAAFWRNQSLGNSQQVFVRKTQFTVGFNGDANELSKAEWPTNAALVVPVGEGAFHDKVLEHTWPTISTRPQGEGRSVLCDPKDAALVQSMRFMNRWSYNYYQAQNYELFELHQGYIQWIFLIQRRGLMD